MREVLHALESMGIPFSLNEPLKNHCTWRIGGPADLFVQPRTDEDVAAAVSAFRRNDVPWLVIGRGSNLLFDDDGFRGAILKIGRSLGGFEIREDRVTVRAGTWAPCLARASASAGLSGLEHAVGIPGNVGGLIAMNGGSLRRSIGDSVEWVRFLDEDGALKVFSPEECGFSYRHSCFQDGRRVVVEIGLRLKRSTPEDVRSEMEDVLKERKRKFPLAYPNCGSVFSNDPDIFSLWGAPGRVIELCGLKGLRLGDAMVSEKHANFIINLGDAGSSDVIGLVRTIRSVVRDSIGRDIPCEVRYVEPEKGIVPLHEIFRSGDNPRFKKKEQEKGA